MAKITRKQLLITLSLLVVIAGTNTATYLISQSRTNTIPQISNTSAEKNDPAEILEKAAEKSPDTTITPIQELHAKPQDYLGKTITTIGMVYETNGNTLLVQPGENAAAIRLSFVDGFDKKELSLNSPYVVTGTLTQEVGGPTQFKVTTAKKADS